MSIWDKAKVLGGERMDVRYAEGAPFIVYGMKIAGEIELDNGMAPATKTQLLTEPVAPDGKGGFQVMKEREAVVVGTLSSPIANMAEEATAEDFPVYVAWKSVPTKTREKATVLDFLGEASEKAPAVPGGWDS